jgi:hypothetical protein
MQLLPGLASAKDSPGEFLTRGNPDMSKVSTLARHSRELLAAMLLIAFVALTSGCGGGGSSAAAPPPSGDFPPVVPPVTPPAPAPVEGIATPTSVAVVTATNAQ